MHSDCAPTGSLTEHPRAHLVPAPSARQYTALAADISQRGIVAPLDTTSASLLLDGRQRLRAARQLGLEEVPVRVVEPEDEIAFMLLAALRRRHLSASQRAALALELQLYQHEREQARQRSRANLRNSPEVATLPPRGERSRELAARLVDVSPRTIQDALIVRDADPELFEQVKAGEIAVEKAARRIRQQRKREHLDANP
ncbi:MAG: ParB/RepB/Spo0J family partition protein, partial [Actinobacteria bacterium]|nr:ParB/RepB/Spo0J family partition protein [Actinomycetota bacterium]